MGPAPLASAACTLAEESGIESRTLQCFLARYAGLNESRGSAKRLRHLRASFSKTLLLMDASVRQRDAEGSRPCQPCGPK